MEYIRIIIDVAVAVILLATVIIGVKRGFVKTCLGLIYVVLAIVITAMATSPLTQVIIDGTDWSDSLQEKLEEALVEEIPNAYARVFYDEIDDTHEGKELVYQDSVTGERVAFSKIMDEDPLIKAFGITSLIEPAAEELLAEQAEANDIAYDDVNNEITLIEAIVVPLTSVIVTAIVGVALFIVSLIVLKLILWLIGQLVKRLYLVHFLDKLLGGILGLVLGLVFVFIILTVVQLMSGLDFMATVNEYLSETVLTKFLMDNNIIYNLLIKNLDLEALFGSLASSNS